MATAIYVHLISNHSCLHDHSNFIIRQTNLCRDRAIASQFRYEMRIKRFAHIAGHDSTGVNKQW